MADGVRTRAYFLIVFGTTVLSVFYGVAHDLSSWFQCMRSYRSF